MTTEPPSVPSDYEPNKFVRQFAKHELQWLAEHHMRKAQEAHQDARAWMNRALVAESQLAVLRTAYEPTSTKRKNPTQ